jgi:hypothetical protein
MVLGGGGPDNHIIEEMANFKSLECDISNEYVSYVQENDLICNVAIHTWNH